MDAAEIADPGLIMSFVSDAYVATCGKQTALWYGRWILKYVGMSTKYDDLDFGSVKAYHLEVL